MSIPGRTEETCHRNDNSGESQHCPEHESQKDEPGLLALRKRENSSDLAMKKGRQYYRKNSPGDKMYAVFYGSDTHPRDCLKCTSLRCRPLGGGLWQRRR